MIYMQCHFSAKHWQILQEISIEKSSNKVSFGAEGKDPSTLSVLL